MKNKFLLLIFFFPLAISCNKNNNEPILYRSDFPDEIGNIMINKCAISGCHNTYSYEAAAGLNLSSWEDLFKGSRNNSSVIPYRPDQSFLFFSINTFPDLGSQIFPTMPYGENTLNYDETMLIYNWIEEGAPNINGYVKFSENVNRKKLYVSNQGCDLVTVFDLESKLIMGVVDVGNSNAVESPHDMLVAPDGKYWYTVFYAGNTIEKYSCEDDKLVADLSFSDYEWHAMCISEDSKYAIASHATSDGKIALVDLENMELIAKYQGSGLFEYPHGLAFSEDGNTFYAVCLRGNFFYKVNISSPTNPLIEKITLEPGETPTVSGNHLPYEIDFSPDFSHYYVTCQGTFEVRVFDAANDSLVTTIASSGIPQLGAFSESSDYLFVTNMEDSTLVNSQSSVDIINYQTNTLIKSIYTGHQPRGIAVDDQNGYVFIANRNVYPGGPAPHHTTECEGYNGYITIIDLVDLELLDDFRVELSVDPYSISIRKN